MAIQALILGKDMCNTGIYAFYKTLAELMGVEPDDSMSFNCTKVCVTRGIQDEIFDHYRKKGSDEAEIGALWAQIGPKANVEAKNPNGLTFNYMAIVEDGFLSGDEEEEEEVTYRPRKRY